MSICLVLSEIAHLFVPVALIQGKQWNMSFSLQEVLTRGDGSGRSGVGRVMSQECSVHHAEGRGVVDHNHKGHCVHSLSTAEC